MPGTGGKVSGCDPSGGGDSDPCRPQKGDELGFREDDGLVAGVLPLIQPTMSLSSGRLIGEENKMLMRVG